MPGGSLDETMQIRGGRGYEKERSLAARGEAPVGVERWMRDTRINLIFEGSSEIMHLFMAREAVDKHLEVAGAMIDPKVPVGEEARRPAAHRRLLRTVVPEPLDPLALRAPVPPASGGSARHLRFVERSSRQLAREIFHAMLVFRAATERKQAFLFRLVDVANELFAMSASAARAAALRRAGHPEARQAAVLADHFCDARRRRVKDLFRDLWRNDDAAAYRLGRAVLAGEHAWLEHGGVPLGVTVEDLRPRDPVKAKPAEGAPARQPAVVG